MHMDSTLGGSTFTSRGELSPASAGSDSQRGTRIDSPDPTPLQAQMSSILAENRELRAEVETLKADRARMAEILSRLTEVLGSKSADRLVHDVRNVLNERELYRTLADTIM
jgi:hypothetical protein